MSEQPKKLEITVDVKLPGGATLAKLLGPTLATLSTDLERLYAFGRDRIVAAAAKKIRNLEDGKRANLRVARDVFWHGSVADGDVAAQYFGGILASSRSSDGKDEDSLQFVAAIRSLSSKQLLLYYVIYRALNVTWSTQKILLNPGAAQDLAAQHVFFASNDLHGGLGINLDTALYALAREGLIGSFRTDDILIKNEKPPKFLPHVDICPSSFGILLYAAAYNRVADWRKVPSDDFGPLDGAPELPVHGDHLGTMLKAMGYHAA